MPELWRIAPGQQLLSRCWDDEYVVFNSLSGDTHLLDSDSMAVLDRLRLSPASIATLSTQFSDGIDPDDALALPETLATMLSHLKALFLVDVTATPC